MAERTDKAWRELLGGVDRSGPPLQLQLRQALVAAIESGALPPDMRLPASRRLAALLGLSRNTVIAAIRMLTEAGYLDSRRGSGVYVIGRQAPAIRVPPHEPAPGGWLSLPALQPSLFRRAETPQDWHSYPYPLLYGQTDPELFPIAAWRECMRAISSVREIRAWSQDLGDADDPELCRQIRSLILPMRGIWAAEDEVMITMGAQQGLFLVAQLFLSGGRTVGIENPGYPDLRSIVRLFTNSVEYLAVDDQGAVPGPALIRSDAVFLTCNSQCPTTARMPRARRMRFLDAAARAGTMIVEDDCGAEVPEEDGPGALKALDRSGNVIHAGSLTKMLAPGLRVGYLVGPAEVITELRALRGLMMRHPPANIQRALAAFLSLGHYHAYLARMAEVMRDRQSACIAALTTHLPDVLWQHSAGSTGFWLTLPEDADCRAVADEARRHGVLVEPGDGFYADPSAGRRNLRIGVGAIRTGRIDEAVARLAAALRRQQGGAAGRPPGR